MGLQRTLEEAATCSGFAVSLAALEWILMGLRQRVREARSLVEEIDAACRWKGRAGARAELCDKGRAVARVTRLVIERRDSRRWVFDLELGTWINVALIPSPLAMLLAPLGLVAYFGGHDYWLDWPMPANTVVLVSPLLLVFYVVLSHRRAWEEVRQSVREVEAALCDPPQRRKRRLEAVIRPWGYLPGEEQRRAPIDAAVPSWVKVSAMDYIRR